jgi:Arc/MetJ family transcription regulator
MAIPATHRTTVEIEVSAFERARKALGTRGYKETVNEALRAVSRAEQLRRGALLIRSGGLDLITPAELEQKRRPRVM